MASTRPKSETIRMSDALPLAFGRRAPEPPALWLGGAAALAVLAAGVLHQIGPAGGALLALVCGATLGLAALLAATVLPLTGKARRVQARAMADLLAHDADPVIVTDRTGAILAANVAATAQPDPGQRLHGWCVDPPRLVAALLDEVGARGTALRDLRRPDRSLRVALHRAGPGGAQVIWRLTEGAIRGTRTLDTLGLPVVTLAPGTGEPYARNAAARAVLDDLSEVATLAAASGAAPPDVQLPGGERVFPLSVEGRDGLVDIVLLPTRHSLAVPARADAPGQDFDDIPVALAQLGADGRILATNRLARTLLGLPAGEARFFWEAVEGLGRPVSDWLEDARAGRALGRPEVVRATLTDQETFVQVILRRGLAGALIAVISDATELKSLEARFVQSQKMQAIGQLAGGIAHDFNNVLTAIAGHCDLLLLNRDRFDPDYDDLLQIHQNANRAAALVRQLLAFSRKQTLKTEIVGLEGLLEDLTHLLTRLVGERITLSLTHDPGLGPIRADRRQLEQVVMNLVVNARDAMPMGGTIRVDTCSLRLETDLEHGRARVPPGSYARIRVIDEGVGIAPDIIDKIFEPFFTTKRVGEGTGLGLSTAYGIVKQMGGFIFCDSVEGSGTVFSLYFATVEAPPGARDEGRLAALASRAPPSLAIRPVRTPIPQIVPPISTARGRTVLLVEDEAPVRAFAARALRHQGYQVFEAQDGEQALEFLADTTIDVDLFVTDVIMPGIDGPGWVTRALADRPGTPVVFISGYTEDTLSAALTRIPRAVFLGKPFSLHDLSETIARQLSP